MKPGNGVRERVEGALLEAAWGVAAGRGSGVGLGETAAVGEARATLYCDVPTREPTPASVGASPAVEAERRSADAGPYAVEAGEALSWMTCAPTSLAADHAVLAGDGVSADMDEVRSHRVPLPSSALLDGAERAAE